jgi:hypothetical protein
MIKFFRHIRQRLLSENKFSKYLIYATGEIILVVIGILLALQINNWNQDRKDRTSERKLLDNIHRDFVLNKIKFDSIKAINYRNLANLDSIVAILPMDSTTWWQKSRKYRKHLKTETYNPYSSTVDALINSNSLELIQDEELQRYLVSWKDVLLDYLEEEAGYMKMMKEEFLSFQLANYDWKFGENNKLPNREEVRIIMRNHWINRRNHMWGIIRAIEEEPIENHINEIIRLTQPVEK